MQTPESLTAQEVADALGPLGRPVPPVPLIATWSPAERAAILAWVADWQEAERAELEFEAPPPPPLDAWLADPDQAPAPLDPWLSATGVRAVSQRQQVAALEAWTDYRYPEAAADHPGTVGKIRARCRAAADDLRRLDQIRAAPTPPPWAEPWLRALADRERPLPTQAALRLGRDAFARLSRIVLPPAPPAEEATGLRAEIERLRVALACTSGEADGCHREIDRLDAELTGIRAALGLPADAPEGAALEAIRSREQTTAAAVALAETRERELTVLRAAAWEIDPPGRAPAAALSWHDDGDGGLCYSAPPPPILARVEPHPVWAGAWLWRVGEREGTAGSKDDAQAICALFLGRAP